MSALKGSTEERERKAQIIEDLRSCKTHVIAFLDTVRAKTVRDSQTVQKSAPSIRRSFLGGLVSVTAEHKEEKPPAIKIQDLADRLKNNIVTFNLFLEFEPIPLFADAYSRISEASRPVKFNNEVVLFLLDFFSEKQRNEQLDTLCDRYSKLKSLSASLFFEDQNGAILTKIVAFCKQIDAQSCQNFPQNQTVFGELSASAQ